MEKIIDVRHVSTQCYMEHVSLSAAPATFTSSHAHIVLDSGKQVDENISNKTPVVSPDVSCLFSFDPFDHVSQEDAQLLSFAHKFFLTK